MGEIFNADNFGSVTGAIIGFVFYVRFTYNTWDYLLIGCFFLGFLISILLRYIENKKIKEGEK